MLVFSIVCFFFKQKTAYEMRISDWSSDVCSSDLLESLRSRIDAWLVKDEGSGRFQIDREAFTDADVFALELKYIFERNWVFIAHESQVAKTNDFLTTFIVRQPVILT